MGRVDRAPSHAATWNSCRPLFQFGTVAWTQRYGPELEVRWRRHLKPTHKSWRVDDPIEVSDLNVTMPPVVRINPGRRATAART